VGVEDRYPRRITHFLGQKSARTSKYFRQSRLRHADNLQTISKKQPHAYPLNLDAKTLGEDRYQSKVNQRCQVHSGILHKEGSHKIA